MVACLLVSVEWQSGDRLLAVSCPISHDICCVVGYPAGLPVFCLLLDSVCNPNVSKCTASHVSGCSWSYVAGAALSEGFAATTSSV